MQDARHNGFDVDSTNEEESVSGAFERVVDASQRMLSDHIELIRLEVRDGMTHVVTAGALVGTGVLFAFAAWCSLMAALVACMVPTLSLAASLLVVALLTAAGSAVCVAFGVREVPVAQADSVDD
ncbi:MAG TPA: phage holin family protein [Candidatus Acidoferrales bacterium]|nr:phage holin family protein [Candidatus Acidoferrales bacterium]